MCGIAGIHRLGDAPVARLGSLSDNLLLAIESRGTDATGLCSLLDDGRRRVIKRTLPASHFIVERGRLSPAARTVLLHTRFRTTGSLKVKDAHPHTHGSVTAVHNGTIYNHAALFSTFGIERHATVDSEIIPALVDFSGWSKLEQAIGLLHGPAAVGILNASMPRELALARTYSYPLVYAVCGDVLLFASTDHALRRAWWNTYKQNLPAKPRVLGPGAVVRVSDGEISRGRVQGRHGEPIGVQAFHPARPRLNLSGPTKSPKGAKRARRRQATAMIAADKVEARSRLDKLSPEMRERIRSRSSFSLKEIDELLDLMGYC